MALVKKHNNRVAVTSCGSWSCPCSSQGPAAPSMPPTMRPFTSSLMRSLPWRHSLTPQAHDTLPTTGLPVMCKLFDAGYPSHGGATGPVRFPNLITGLNCSPAHAARTALYTRYTPSDWLQNNMNQFCNSKNSRMISEKVRGESVILMRESDVIKGQRESTKHLGQRVTDINVWKNDLAEELDKNVAETHRLMDTRAALEKAIKETEGPLHIVQENMYNREAREGIDKVHDKAEQSLLRECDTIRCWQDKLRRTLDRVNCQIGINRAARFEVERDLTHKEIAAGIDSTCVELNNASRGIAFRNGIELVEACVSTPDTWAEFSYTNMQRSQNERANSQRMRIDVDTAIGSAYNDIWQSWTMSNDAISQRARETMEAKSNLQMYLHKLTLEIFDIEKNMELLRKAIMDKAAPLQVAQTRLESRMHRPDIEMCCDSAHGRLVIEVQNIHDSIDQLQRKLRETEATHQQMLKTRSDLEHDIQVKANTLFIDREKCLGMRKSFPISTFITHRC